MISPAPLDPLAGSHPTRRRYSVIVGGGGVYAQRAWSVRNLLGLHLLVGVRWQPDEELPRVDGWATRGEHAVVELVDHDTQTVVLADGLWLPRALEVSPLARRVERPNELYPDDLSASIDAMNIVLYEEIYRGLISTSAHPAPGSISQALRRLARLDGALSENRYLLGEALTDVDVHLYALAVRLDPAITFHQPSDEARLTDFPQLCRLSLELHQRPEVGLCTPFGRIARQYRMRSTSATQRWESMWNLRA